MFHCYTVQFPEDALMKGLDILIFVKIIKRNMCSIESCTASDEGSCIKSKVWTTRERGNHYSK